MGDNFGLFSDEPGAKMRQVMARRKRVKPLYVGASLIEKLNTAAFGPAAATASFSEADCWAEVLTKPCVSDSERMWLVEEAHRAFIGGNADFFNAVAFLSRNWNGPVQDRLRYGLLSSFLGVFGQNRRWTKQALMEELKKHGFDLDERHLRRLCKELGIKLAPGRSGRPAKNPGH
jgi:hypothetical protein